jgi:hypothetical protein
MAKPKKTPANTAVQFPMTITPSERQGFAINGVPVATSKISDMLTAVPTADRWGIFTPHSVSTFQINPNQTIEVSFDELPDGVGIVDVLQSRVAAVQSAVQTFISNVGAVRSIIQSLLLSNPSEAFSQASICEYVISKLPGLTNDIVVETTSGLLNEERVRVTDSGDIMLQVW